MIRNYCAIRDYETGSRNKFKTQPIQLAAIIVDVQRLEIVPDSLFQSYILPEFDDKKCAEKGIDPLQDEALSVNKITREQLVDAPEPKLVWEMYKEYLTRYNLKGKDGSKWDAPAVGGYNNVNFDDIIDQRMCDSYGPKQDEYGGYPLYHPFYNFDVQMLVQNFFHAKKINRNDSISMDAVREYLGYKKDGAHDARIDVTQTADLLIRFLKLTKNLVNGNINLPKGKAIKFKNCVNGAV